MHPGENLRVPSINNDDDAGKWQTAPITTNNNSNNSLKNSKNNNGISVIRYNGSSNGSSNFNGTSDRSNTEHKWPPLLGEVQPVQLQRDTDSLKKHKNNNEWSIIGGGGSEDKKRSGSLKNGNGGVSTPKSIPYEKYTPYWPSCEDTNGKLCGNNNGSLINSKTLLGNANGYPAELESLTGRRKKNLQDDDEDAESDDVSQCGLGGCQPRWTRSFASTHCFMVVFLIAWVLQGMYYTYFVSMITTIEKLFQIKSKTTGLLMSVVEIGQISTSLFLTYYAGRGHRPRWIACGTVLFAIASFGCTLPHFFYGDQLLEAHLKLSGHISRSQLGNLSQSEYTLKNALATAQSNLCLNNKTSTMSSTFETLISRNEDSCDSDNVKLEQDNQNDITSIVLAIFAVCLLLIGIGQTAVSTLALPYIDDNVASRESPIYIAISIGVRILGPAAGFILGSICTRIPYPNLDPSIKPADAQFVGSWYLGLLLVSSCMAFTSLALFMFPRNLRGNRIPPPKNARAIEPEKKPEVRTEEAAPKFKDFPKTIKRQLSNDILMFRTASSVLHLLPVAGLYTFLPKYMETQFNLAAHDANLISAFGGILVMGVGIVISGIIILKFTPTAKSVAAWIAFTAIIYSIGMGLLMFVGCPMSNLAGYEQVKAFQDAPQGSLCSNVTQCSCSAENFSPVCGANGVTYFSSCHAGCSNVDIISKGIGETTLLYSNCSCLDDQSSYSVVVDDLSFGQAISGSCDGHCQKFVIFILMFAFFVFVHSSGEVGSMLLIMRCTDPKDKAMAMGVIQFAIGLFGNVPCPIIYGAIIDSACLVWETVCDKVGACSLYDGDTFRTFFFGATSGIMFLAFIMDVVVWKKADRIIIDPEDSSSSETEYEKAETSAPESTV